MLLRTPWPDYSRTNCGGPTSTAQAEAEVADDGSNPLTLASGRQAIAAVATTLGVSVQLFTTRFGERRYRISLRLPRREHPNQRRNRRSGGTDAAKNRGRTHREELRR